MIGLLALVTCDREMGRWTVRVNGRFVFHSRREYPAIALAAHLTRALVVHLDEDEDEDA